MRSLVALDREERTKLVAHFGGRAIHDSAKALGVGVETMMSLLDPCGRTSPTTLAKVREKLKGLT